MFELVFIQAFLQKNLGVCKAHIYKHL